VICVMTRSKAAIARARSPGSQSGAPALGAERISAPTAAITAATNPIGPDSARAGAGETIGVTATSVVWIERVFEP
jgi:hypothetical protein